MSQMDRKITQIIEAAAEEFLAKGFQAASMHNVACEAEVSKRTLYKYFPTKDKLFDALVDELLAQVHSMYQIAYQADKPFHEQLEAVVRKKIQFISSEPFIRLSKIVISEMIKSRKIADSQLRKLEASEAIFVAWIDDAKKDAAISVDQDSQTIANQVHYMIKGEIFWPILLGMESPDFDLEAATSAVVAFFVRSFCESD